jgi:hypothetical protein
MEEKEIPWEQYELPSLIIPLPSELMSHDLNIFKDR